MSITKWVLVLYLIGILVMVGAPFIVEAVVWVLAKCVPGIRESDRLLEIETAAIKLADRTEYLVVASTLLGILAAVYFHFAHFAGHEDEPYLNLVLYHMLPSVWINSGMLYSYYRSIRTDAGKPTAAHLESGRACKICGGPRPLFAFHCITCDQCVLFMDHHCLFTANCVGQNNFRFFVSFIFWAWLAACYALWLSFEPEYHCDINLDGSRSCKKNIKTMLLLASMAFLVITSAFWWFMVYLMCTGQTTRSFLDKRERNPFDPYRHRGALANIELRLGPRRTWWRYLVPGAIEHLEVPEHAAS